MDSAGSRPNSPHRNSQPKASGDLSKAPDDTQQPSSTAPQLVIVLANKGGFGTQMLVNMINRDLNSQCQHLAKSQDLTQLADLVLIDCHDLSARLISDWLFDNIRRAHKVALFNVPHQPSYERLIEWPKLNGLFYEGTQEAMLVQGLRYVLAGDLWLPRKILANHLEASRSNHPKQPNLTLTQRETDILRLLKNGATNAAIGSALGMSANTVKSHLYKVYRKIGASNRVDAGNWARVNID